MNSYTCAACGGVFEKTWSDNDAQEERQKNGWEEVDCAVVCDDCYLEMQRQGIIP